MKVKGKDHYDLNCIDHITKYVTAHLFVEKRTLEKCKELYKQIKITCYEQIIEIYKKERHKPVKKRNLIRFVCDGFENYRTAHSKVLRVVTKLTFGIPIACIKYGLGHNNNPVERYNGKINDRIKIMRGGFYSFEGAEAFLNLNHIIHNFVNPHQQLKGRTPAEAADVNIPLKRNKLLNLIGYVRRNHITKR